MPSFWSSYLPFGLSTGLLVVTLSVIVVRIPPDECGIERLSKVGIASLAAGGTLLMHGIKAGVGVAPSHWLSTVVFALSFLALCFLSLWKQYFSWRDDLVAWLLFVAFNETVVWYLEDVLSMLRSPTLWAAAVGLFCFGFSRALLPNFGLADVVHPPPYDCIDRDDALAVRVFN